MLWGEVGEEMTKTIEELKADVKKADANFKASGAGWGKGIAPKSVLPIGSAGVAWVVAWSERDAARKALKAALKKEKQNE